MKIFKSRATKAAAVALAAALQVYAAGGFALAAPEAAVAVAAAAPGQQAQGRLTTTGDNPVAVNGNSAKTGETIFSGQQIQTPSGTTARVQLPGLGSVEVRPNSNVTLTFGDGKISVVVLSGCVRLSADAGVTGTIQSGGKTITTDSDDRVIENCDDGVVPIAPASAGGLSSGTATALTVGAVTAFSLLAREVISDSDNPVPNDCTPIPGTTSPLTPPSGCTP